MTMFSFTVISRITHFMLINCWFFLLPSFRFSHFTEINCHSLSSLDLSHVFFNIRPAFFICLFYFLHASFLLHCLSANVISLPCFSVITLHQSLTCQLALQYLLVLFLYFFSQISSDFISFYQHTDISLSN